MSQRGYYSSDYDHALRALEDATAQLQEARQQVDAQASEVHEARKRLRIITQEAIAEAVFRATAGDGTAKPAGSEARP